MKRMFFMLALLAATAIQGWAQVEGVTAQLTLEQDQCMPGEDLQLKVKITNRSGQPLTFGRDNNWLTLSIVAENNYIVSKIGDMPETGEFTLLSGQTGTRTFNPTPYFDFRRPGRYRIGATIQVDQWGKEIACQPVSLVVANGIPLPSFTNLPFGVPPAPGASNSLPEVRHYSLIKVAYLDRLALYFRLTDDSGRTLSVFPLAPMLSFSDPEGQLDRGNNFHVLSQIGARAFGYFVLSPQGRLLLRQTYVYGMGRPTLRNTDDGGVFVAGGQRRVSETDFPAPAPQSARSN
ncbi:MAG: hypothetical protein ABSG59_14755 [Verrucomicrobiota bacterium]